MISATSPREIAEHLKSICRQEKIKCDEDALLLVAKAGAGSMRDSLSLLDRLLSIGEKHLTIETVEQLLGARKAQTIFELVQSIGKGDVKDVLTRSTKLVMGGLSTNALLANLIDHLRNLLVLRTCGKDSELVEMPGISMDELFAERRVLIRSCSARTSRFLKSCGEACDRPRPAARCLMRHSCDWRWRSNSLRSRHCSPAQRDGRAIIRIACAKKKTLNRQ